LAPCRHLDPPGVRPAQSQPSAPDSGYRRRPARPWPRRRRRVDGVLPRAPSCAAVPGAALCARPQASLLHCAAGWTEAHSRPQIGVITYPGSQKNKVGFDEMRRLLDEQPNVDHVVLDRITDIPAILARFAAAGIDVLAVGGGDGTVQAVLTELFGKRPFKQVPLLAVIPRGMTNMIAADVGVARRGVRATPGALARLVAASPAALAAATERRRILRAENVLDREPQYGMFFGGAGIPRAIDACRSKVHPLRIKSDSAAAVTLAGLLGSWLLGRGKDARHASGIFYGDRITVTLDDSPPETLEALIILATTLDRLILRSRPFWGGGG